LVWSNDAAIREGLRHVPGGGALLTTTYYAPHLSQRRWLEMLPKAPIAGLDPRADVLFLNVVDQRAWTCTDYFDVLNVAAQSGFGVEFEKDGVLVLLKGRDDNGRLRTIVSSWRGCG
jgi:hypothetical protein